MKQTQMRQAPAFLGVAHIIAVNAHCIGDAGTKVDRLIDQGGEGTRFLKCKPVGKILERILELPASANFEIGQVNVGGERGITWAQFSRDAFK